MTETEKYRGGKTMTNGGIDFLLLLFEELADAANRREESLEDYLCPRGYEVNQVKALQDIASQIKLTRQCTPKQLLYFLELLSVWWQCTLPLLATDKAEVAGD